MILGNSLLSNDKVIDQLIQDLNKKLDLTIISDQELKSSLVLPYSLQLKGKGVSNSLSNLITLGEDSKIKVGDISNNLILSSTSIPSISYIKDGSQITTQIATLADINGIDINQEAIDYAESERLRSSAGLLTLEDFQNTDNWSWSLIAWGTYPTSGGNPGYSLTGLEVGQTYTLSFSLVDNSDIPAYFYICKATESDSLLVAHLTTSSTGAIKDVMTFTVEEGWNYYLRIGGSLDATNLTNQVNKINHIQLEKGSEVTELEGKAVHESALKSYIKNTDYATSSEAGIIKINNDYGFGNISDNNYGILAASSSDIDSKLNEYKPITAKTIDYAVMAGLTNSLNHTWTTEQQLSARITLQSSKIISAGVYQDSFDMDTKVDSSTYNDFTTETNESITTLENEMDEVQANIPIYWDITEEEA